jgi:hypothetical protein
VTPIPVICDDCGRIWITEQLVGVTGGGSANVQLQNVGVSPCPYCGGTGHVPDGMYRLQENAAEYLGALKPAELRALLHVVSEAQAQNLNAEQVAERIEEEVPAAAEVGGLLKMDASALRDWLAILLALLSIILPLVEHQQQPLTQEQTRQAFVQALEEVQAKQQPPKPSPPTSSQRTIRREGPKLGRNDPCHCGSGKKFKHCHGR